MNYCKALVMDYLRADRALFLNEECMIQLDPCRNPDKTKHWLCDVVVVDFNARTIWLCEITYDRILARLLKRLGEWAHNWPDVRKALWRDCKFPQEWDWPLRVWAFVPKELVERLTLRLNGMDVRITALEDVMPWTYRDWDREPEAPKAPVASGADP
jgi:hypothetical protein